MNGIDADPPGRVTLVLGTSAGGTGAHVRMLAAGLAGRGISVSVAGPSAADTRFSFSAVPGVSFTAGRDRGPAAAGRSREHPAAARGCSSAVDAAGHAASRQAHVSRRAHVVHAHGLRAGALTVLALLLVRGRRRPGVVVTVHNAPPAGGGAAGLVYRLLERVVARGADLVLCVSPDLERRMRAAGARQVRTAVIAAPDASPGSAAGAAAAAPLPGPAPAADRPACPVGPACRPAQLRRPPPTAAAASEETASPWPIPSAGRPIVLAVGRLAAQKGFGVLARGGRRLAGPGPGAARGDRGGRAAGRETAGPGRRARRRRGCSSSTAVTFPRCSPPRTVFVLPSRWEGQPLVLQEALRAGTPVVATRVGGIPGLTGQDAALLVPPGDAAGARGRRPLGAHRPAAGRPAARRGRHPRRGAARQKRTRSAPPWTPTPRSGAAPVCDNRPVPLTSTCLCLLTRTDGDGTREVLLGRKKTGLGTGKIVGLGGHVEPGESAAEAAAREAKEESGICVTPGSLALAAHVTFLFPAHPSWDMDHRDLHHDGLGRRAGRDRGDPAAVVPGRGPALRPDVGRRPALAAARPGRRATPRHLQLRRRQRNRRHRHDRPAGLAPARTILARGFHGLRLPLRSASRPRSSRPVANRDEG